MLISRDGIKLIYGETFESMEDLLKAILEEPMSINRQDYCEYHESREYLCESFPAEMLRRRHAPAKSDHIKCEACRVAFDSDEINEDGLCGNCEKNIAGFEEGKI
jgi:hypothetical protein